MKIWTRPKFPTEKKNFAHVCAELQTPEYVVVPQKKVFF